MTYGFMMFKPKGAVPAIDDLGEDTLVLQEPAVVVAGLTALCPDIAWRREDDGGWFGALDGEDGWYEFRIGAEPDLCWTISTSHRASTRKLVPEICNALGVVAFDGQVMSLIAPERP
ncbi:hypothetical protein JQ604_18345 [Bradyrhizobium jicamae]|uniref:hypothetical protein n=1 Tax=Bradyrhizobium jicamae TaxID=280332 RepID=UPI001BA9C9EF|nr:hypothetical protein [Bradyrhizobium jicamae]MBR0754149.1 hypothetical protein [Bradyrhizobium jicamae]